MIRDLCAFVGPLVTAFCWTFSLRRTPWGGAWLTSAVAWSMGAAAAGVAMLTDTYARGPHAGMHINGPATILGVQVVFAILACLWTACFEFDSDVQTWRQEHRARRRPRRSNRKWRVAVQLTEEGARVTVSSGSHERLIGTADPVEDMDSFMNLKAEGERAAETLNALKLDS